jgi:hypothetical protein
MSMRSSRAWIGLFFLLTSCGAQEQESGFFEKESTNYGLVCRLDSPFDTTEAEITLKAIYGIDNRLDWYESPGLTKDYWAKATLALMTRADLVFDDEENVYWVHAPSYKNVVKLCEGEPFAAQPSAAYCSGFLVSEKHVVTAGHCVRNETDCRATQFVFDYAKTEAEQGAYSVPKDSVYNCGRVVASQTLGQDFAVIELDRPVQDRTPLNIRRSGQVNVGEQVMLIGHPMGLPSKIADGGFIQRVGEQIEASVDAFAGNSGSVILNSVTGLAEGFLVAGEADFFYTNGCYREARCGPECEGEVITPISAIAEYIPNIVYDNPVCENE